MQKPENPLADKRTLLAVGLVVLFMIAWQTYMAKMYPPVVKDPVQSPAAQASPAAGPAPSVSTETSAIPTTEKAKKTTTIQQEQFFSYENDDVRFTVSSRGMGLKEFAVKNFKDVQGNPIRLGFAPLAGLFETRWTATSVPLEYEVREIGKGHFEGIAKENGTTFKRELIYNPGNKSFSSTLVITGATADVSKGISILVPETIRSSESSSIFFPSYDHQDFFVSHSGTNETVNFNHSKENIRQEFKTVSLISVGDQYFTLAVMDRSEIAPEVLISSDVTGKTAFAELSYRPLQLTGELSFNQTLYAGPKSIDVLKKIDPNMANVIDFGYLAFIAKPLLYVMKWFYGYVGNWGVAIILLTLLVRLVVLPFNLMSFRSMKAMQKIQPLIAGLRERHKNDPMALNRETMALMKEHKANPLGGCLPMLLQIPIFFALFRVIGSSVELYQSPFLGWWIHDLSAHDPVYILPVVLGLTMFLQQKITPTTMDPAQAKIMMFLPLVFTVFMLQLPAGLTLYMVVSAVFGIVQQWYVLKDSPAPVPVKKTK